MPDVFPGAMDPVPEATLAIVSYRRQMQTAVVLIYGSPGQIQNASGGKITLAIIVNLLYSTK